MPPVLPLAYALRRAKSGGIGAGDGSVLPRAREAAASVPVNPVEQARVLPTARRLRARRHFGGLVAGYDKQIGDYQTAVAGAE